MNRRAFATALAGFIAAPKALLKALDKKPKIKWVTVEGTKEEFSDSEHRFSFFTREAEGTHDHTAYINLTTEEINRAFVPWRMKIKERNNQ